MTALVSTPQKVPRIKNNQNRIVSFVRSFGRRLGQLLILLFVISTSLFFLLHLTGDPALVLLGDSATPEQIDKVREYYGLDKPLLVQYFIFLKNAAILDFGNSYQYGLNAMDIVLKALPSTFVLTIFAMTVNIIFGFLFGAIIGTREHKFDGKILLYIILFLQGIPAFVIGLVLIQFFAAGLGWFPSFGNASFKHLVLPGVTLAMLLLPSTTRVVASATQEAWEQPYVRTALSFGLSNSRILINHVVPNALLGAIGLLGVQFGLLMGGSLVVEVIFSWSGLGMRMVDAARLFDFPILQAGTFVIAIAVFAGTLVVDLLVPILDPRVGRL